MRIIVLIAVALAFTFAALGQRHTLGSVNAETPEGKVLQAAMVESDEAKKIELLEQYVSQFPAHAGVGWAFAQLQALYSKAGNHDKVIELGQKLIALDPADAEAAHAALKSAEAKKDDEAILKWSGVASDAAKKWLATAKPETMEDDAWKHSQEFAQGASKYSEYSMYAAALAATDPQKVFLFAETLEQRNPQSEYLVQIMPKLAVAARQANAMDKAISFGERAFERGQLNDDLLLAMADAHMQKKSHDKAVLYSAKLIDLMNTAQKPQGVAEADWEKNKTTKTGVAYWIQGVTYSTQNKFAEADKALRSALPLVKDNGQLLGMGAFHLGLANYRMGSAKKSKALLSEALKYSQQAASIKNPYSSQAAKNVKVIQSELAAAR